MFSKKIFKELKYYWKITSLYYNIQSKTQEWDVIL